MARRYLEDFRAGERWTSAALTVDAEFIAGFGRKYDPQPFHTDAEAAKASPFGGMIASGWQMAAVAMGLGHDLLGLPGDSVAALGVDELRWFQPARMGDTVTIEQEVVEVDPPPRSARRGRVRTRIEMKNQRGELVMRLFGLLDVERASR